MHPASEEKSIRHFGPRYRGVKSVKRQDSIYYNLFLLVFDQFCERSFRGKCLSGYIEGVVDVALLAHKR